MLLIKKVKTKWSSTTKKYYEEKGYVFTKYKDEFEVDIKDLHKGSNVFVEYECDYCHEIKKRKFNEYNKSMFNSRIKKDACINCLSIKRMEETALKNENNELNINDKGYYSSHENRKIELDNYIKKFGTMDKMTSNIEGKRLFDNFINHNDNIYDTAIENGYILENILSYYPTGYFDDFNKIKEKILKFIQEYHRFPRCKEISNVLKIDYRYISKLGGIGKVKQMLNYQDDKDLIDLRGDFNRSFFELLIANYLILNGFSKKYKREQCPFSKSDGNYRSDFTFYLDNGKELHLEAWGFRKDDFSSKRARKYNEIRSIKENLYSKYSEKLICVSIDYELIDDKYTKFQEKLHNLLSPYLFYEFKLINYNNLVSGYKLTDNELFHEVMKFSEDKNILPQTSLITGTLYNEVLKRFTTYKKFAESFDVKTNNIPWNKKDNEEFSRNYYNARNYFGRIPTRNEFMTHSIIDIKSYSNRFNFDKNFSVYDNIIIKYEGMNGYLDFLKYKGKSA